MAAGFFNEFMEGMEQMGLSLFRGPGYLWQGIKLLATPGLRRFVVIPLLLNTLLFAIGIWQGLEWFSVLMDMVGAELPGWLAWLRWLLVPLFAIAVLTVIYFTFTVVANLIGAPFNALLSEKVEKQLTGRVAGNERSTGSVLAGIVPDMLNELGKLFHALLWSIPFLLLFIIPVTMPIAPFAWMVFTAWMLAVEYADYPMGNRGMRGREVRRSLRKKGLLALGFGGAVLLMTIIPVINFLAMPAAVAGATVLWVREYAPAEG